MLSVRRTSTSCLKHRNYRLLSTTSEAVGSHTKWSRPIRPGVVPAYDQALSVIQKDSQAKAAKVDIMASQLNGLDSKSSEYETAAKRLRKLEIESAINDPEIRWNFKHGVNVDMTKPVYRHLAEKKWREQGRLDLLMQRIHQMHVVPDAVSSFTPSADLVVDFSASGSTKLSLSRQGVEPGVFLSSKETVNKPRIRATVFHPETKLYTLVILDLDVPDPQNRSFTTYLHYLKSNIPISAASYLNDIPLDDAIVPYLPPHPQKGTPYHRYATLLLEQADSSNPVMIEAPPERLGFSARQFINEYGIRNEATSWRSSANDQVAHVTGGIHMWRQNWDDGVSQIYHDILQTPEPRYGPPPKIDPYAGKASRYP